MHIKESMRGNNKMKHVQSGQQEHSGEGQLRGTELIALDT